MADSTLTIQLRKKLLRKKSRWKTEQDVLLDGQYGIINYLVMDAVRKRRLRFGSEQRKSRLIRLICIDKVASTQDILTMARQMKLKRPLITDALLLGEQHPSEQNKGPIIFLHEPAYMWSGHSFNMILDVEKAGRSISMISTSGSWKEGCQFAFLLD